MEAQQTADLSQYINYINAPLLERAEKPLAGKSALIVGATRFNGIGLAIAERFALEGVSPIVIVGTVNSKEIAPLVVERLKQYGVDAYSLVGDVTDPISCAEIIRQTIELHRSGVDILVNNAGITHKKSFVDTELDDWNAVVGTKLTGAFLLTREWFRVRNRANIRGGKVINIGSVMQRGNDGQIDYVAANGGIMSLTEGLAYNLGSRGVTANCIIPGFVEGTEMTRGFTDQEKATVVAVQGLAIGRLIIPQEIAAAAAYLAGSDADAVSGAAIVIDAKLGTNYTAPRRLRSAGWRVPPSFARGIVEDLTQEEADTIKKMRKQNG